MLVALLATPAAAARPPSPALAAHWTGGRVPERVLGWAVVLRDGAGRPLWRCGATPPFREPEPCASPMSWLRAPGDFVLSARVDLLDAQPLRLSQAFHADGQEIAFEVMLYGYWNVQEPPERSAPDGYLSVLRVLPAHPGVRLLPARSLAPKLPVFLLENGSGQTLYGSGIWGNFFGFFQQWRDGAWKHLDRGGFCGTVAEGRPLPPRGRIASFEGAFIGAPYPFPAAGRYRYVLRYLTVPWKDWTRPAVGPRTSLREVYQVELPWRTHEETR